MASVFEGSPVVHDNLLYIAATRFLNGRAVRLMTVSVRPGRPNAAASSFLSGIIREPLAGQRAVCPVSPDTEVALASPAKAVEALLCAASSSDLAWADPAPLTMPALTGLRST